MHRFMENQQNGPGQRASAGAWGTSWLPALKFLTVLTRREDSKGKLEKWNWLTDISKNFHLRMVIIWMQKLKTYLAQLHTSKQPVITYVSVGKYQVRNLFWFRLRLELGLFWVLCLIHGKWPCLAEVSVSMTQHLCRKKYLFHQHFIRELSAVILSLLVIL